MACKFSVKRVEFLAWLSVISKSFQFAGQLRDIYECVKIAVDSDALGNGEFVISTSDGVSAIRILNVPISEFSGEKTACLLKFDSVFKVLSSSRKEWVAFEIDADQAVIRTESRYKIPLVLGVDDYPELSTVLPENATILSDLKFLNRMDLLLPLAAKEFERPSLTGVSVSDDFYISTSGICGAVHAREEGEFPVGTVFAHVVKFLGGLSGVGVSGVSIGFTENSLLVKGTDFFYSSNLPVEKFPMDTMYSVLAKWEKSVFRIAIGSAEFQDAISRVLVLDSDKSSVLQFSFLSENQLEISCISEQQGNDSSETISVEVTSGAIPQGFKLGLATHVVRSASRLFADSDKQLELAVVSEREPIFLKQDESRYLFFAMPWKLTR
jgi:DNA polymerase III sliding clamp (beta) subunit (PCNA family)